MDEEGLVEHGAVRNPRMITRNRSLLLSLPRAHPWAYNNYYYAYAWAHRQHNNKLVLPLVTVHDNDDFKILELQKEKQMEQV